MRLPAAVVVAGPKRQFNLAMIFPSGHRPYVRSSVRAVVTQKASKAPRGSPQQSPSARQAGRQQRRRPRPLQFLCSEKEAFIECAVSACLSACYFGAGEEYVLHFCGAARNNGIRMFGSLSLLSRWGHAHACYKFWHLQIRSKKYSWMKNSSFFEGIS